MEDKIDGRQMAYNDANVGRSNMPRTQNLRADNVHVKVRQMINDDLQHERVDDVQLRRAPVPLNQGGQGTCVAYAYAAALSQGLIEKYGVPSDPDKLAEKIKALCPCYDGEFIEEMLNKWNKQHHEEGAAIENLDATWRYHVEAGAVRRIDNFEEAYRAMGYCT